MEERYINKKLRPVYRGELLKLHRAKVNLLLDDIPDEARCSHVKKEGLCKSFNCYIAQDPRETMPKFHGWDFPHRPYVEVGRPWGGPKGGEIIDEESGLRLFMIEQTESN
jgi:hypothetical protein